MIAWLGKILAGIFGTRTLIVGLVTVTLGLVFYNLIVEVIQECMTFALGEINGTSYGNYANPSIGGFAGWFLGQLKIPECISVIVSCVSIRFILRKIPFIRW